MIWHLKAMWDAMFILDPWIALLGFWVAGGLGVWFAGPMAGAPWFLIGAILWLYAWWLQYRLICRWRPYE